MNNAVVTITITFNPDIAVLERQLAALESQCIVLLVDNGSNDENFKDLEKLSARFGARLLALGENKGIASAQNFGLRHIEQALPDCEFVLFLDHDSVPGDDFVGAMLASFKKIKSYDPNLGVLGPAIYEPRAGTFYGFHVLSGIRYRRVLPNDISGTSIQCTTINSAGTFCRLEVAQAIGPFNDDMFIDHVETEWCFRASACGFTLYGINNVTLEHRMGDAVLQVGIFGRTLTLPYRSPHRHQYLMRNSVAMLRRPYIPFIWKAYCVAKIGITLTLFGLFSNERLAQSRAIMRGIGDGIANRTGKIASP